MNQQLTQAALNALNTLLALLGCTATSLVAGTSVAPEQSSTLTGLVQVGPQGPIQGSFTVTIIPVTGGSPTVLTFDGSSYSEFSSLQEYSLHTVVYYSAASQAAEGVSAAYDKLISVS